MNTRTHASLIRFATFAAAACAAFALAPQGASAAQANVSINDNFFGPASLSITAGDTVTWRNNGGTSHYVEALDGSFKSTLLTPGESFSLIFNAPGTYTYKCPLHSGMTGTITVTAAPAPTQTNPNPFPYQQAPQQSAAVSPDALIAQIQALLARVTALQQQIGAGGAAGGSGVVIPGSGSSSANCPRVGVTLRPGSTGDDVSRLQRFLAQDPAIYPEGRITGTYGPLTQQAVQRWQIKYNIVASGSPETNGFGQVGPRTATAISLQCSGGRGAAVSGPVGGYISVTPISGDAPLTVNVTANVNTIKSCGGVVYTLDWGDGSGVQSIPVSAGECKQVTQSLPHTYAYGGTYNVTLSAGDHRTSATVVVNGAGAAGGGTGTQDGNTPQTFYASVTSGTAPLRVTFSGTVTSANKAWCDSGCSITLDFGDGTIGRVSLPIAKNSARSYSAEHTYKNPGTYTAKLHQGDSDSGHLVGTPIVITVAGTQSGGTSYSYGPLGVTPRAGGNPLAVSAAFDLPSACTGYKLSWGDGTSDVTQNDGGATCAQTATTRSFTHQYQNSGTYEVSLQRGPTLSRQDSAVVVISN